MQLSSSPPLLSAPFTGRIEVDPLELVNKPAVPSQQLTLILTIYRISSLEANARVYDLANTPLVRTARHSYR